MPQRGGGKPSAGAFYDSDFSTIDSLLAVSLLYGLQGKNDCRVTTICLSRPNLAVAGFLDAVEHFYHGGGGPGGGKGAPLGMATAGKPGETSPAFVAPFQRKKLDGTPVYKTELKSVIDTADPATVFRNYLEAQQDQNAFCVLAGPATNLAAAIAFAGAELIAAKVKYLVVAGGAFPSGAAEAHFKADIPAARKVFADWPTPIVAAGTEVGAALEFPGVSIDKQFAAADPDNPVADAYRAYHAMPYDTPSWAMAAALYAGRPKEGYFKLSGPGKISVDQDGRTSFTASEKGNHQYLIVDPAQKDKIMLAYIDLASAKPVAQQRFRPPVANDTDKPPATDKPVPPPPPKK
jgi:hypothetical protein